MKIHHSLFSLLLFTALAGCATAPQYRIPEGTAQRASLKLHYSEQSLLAGVIKVSHVQRPILCGKPLQNPQTLFVASHGNPLVSNINAEGLQIPAGERFMVSAFSMQDGFPSCSRVASFVPRADEAYELRFAHQGARGETCSLEIVQMASANGSEQTRLVAPGFQPEVCQN